MNSLDRFTARLRDAGFTPLPDEDWEPGTIQLVHALLSKIEHLEHLATGAVHVDPAGASMKVQSSLVPWLARMLLEAMSGTPNFIEYLIGGAPPDFNLTAVFGLPEGMSPEDARIEVLVTCIKPGGKRPSALVAELRDKVSVLSEQLDRARSSALLAVLPAPSSEEAPPPKRCVRVGVRLREERQRSRLTLRQVASRLRVSHAAVGQWERGQERVSDLRIRQMADLYGTTSDAILDGAVRLSPEASRLFSAGRRLSDAERRMVFDLLDKESA